MNKVIIDNDKLKVVIDETETIGLIELTAKDINDNSKNVSIAINPEDGFTLAIGGVPKFTFGAEGSEISDSDINFSGNRTTIKNLSVPNSTTVPSSSADTGVKDEVRFDNIYIYRCIDTNQWIRFEKDGTAW